MGLILLQPDLGLVLILLVITLALLVVGGVPAKYLAVLAVVGRGGRGRGAQLADPQGVPGQPSDGVHQPR